MTLEEVIRVHERLNKLGWAVFEQFVTVAEAGTADEMEEAAGEGQLNPNAVKMIQEALQDLRRQVSDDDLRDEMTNLIDEIKVFLARGEE